MENEINTRTLQNKKFAVLGDVALDLAYYSSIGSECSVETGLAVRQVSKHAYDAGGAGNLAVDIASLGAQCDLYGICGDDCWADMLNKKLDAFQVGRDGLVREPGFTTFVYHKVYDENFNELPRFDLGCTNVYRKTTLDAVLGKLAEKLPSYDGLLINQQLSRTIHTQYFQRRLAQLLQSVKIPVWIDARRPLHYPNCSYKMNYAEATSCTGTTILSDCLKILHAQLISTSLDAEHTPIIIVTLGQEGAIGFDGRKTVRTLGINFIQKTDPVGAGDAFLATIACTQACGFSLKEMMEFANCSAAVSTRTLLATGHPHIGEVLDLAKNPDYRYNPILAADMRLSTYLPGTEIEIINKHAKSLKYPKVAIFDHDGTISTMRQGWETVMHTLMVEAITGKALANLDTAKLKIVHNTVDQMIEKTTGIQTIMQMAQLVELIKEFGYVSAGNIKTPLAYKEEYSRRLAELLQVKYARFGEGIYDVSDLTMKGALPFLTRLREHNVQIFLASGSDYEDVKFETETFGYSHLFNGGIFGSVGDVSNDPKKLVMTNIVKEIHASPDNVVVFGDGPVEIREGKKHGFLTIGIVSDEQQRFGLNLNKRERLVLAGADILIPDYSWTEKLAQYLGWET